MYKSNIITQPWVYLMINLAKQRPFLGISNMTYDRLSEMVPDQLFGLYVVVFHNYKAVRHILESVYNMSLVKYKYQPLWTFLAELGHKYLLFADAMVGHWYQ